MSTGGKGTVGGALLLAEAATDMTFVFDGSGAQVAGTLFDIGLATPPFDIVDNAPVKVTAELVWQLVNGATRFTGNVLMTTAVICVGAPNAGDVGVDVWREQVKHDQNAVSNSVASTLFRLGKSGGTRLLDVGNGGLAVGQIAQGVGYSFKMQFTITTVANLSAKIIPPQFSTMPSALIRVERQP